MLYQRTRGTGRLILVAVMVLPLLAIGPSRAGVIGDDGVKMGGNGFPKYYRTWCNNHPAKCEAAVEYGAEMAAKTAAGNNPDTNFSDAAMEKLRIYYRNSWHNTFGPGINPAYTYNQALRGGIDYPDCGTWWVPCWKEAKAIGFCALAAGPAGPAAGPSCINSIKDLDNTQKSILVCGAGTAAAGIITGVILKDPFTTVRVTVGVNAGVCSASAAALNWLTSD